MEEIHPAVFSPRKNPKKDKWQFVVDSKETVMKSEEIVRFEIHWNNYYFITTSTDTLKSHKKSHIYHSTKKNCFMRLVVIIVANDVLRLFYFIKFSNLDIFH